MLKVYTIKYFALLKGLMSWNPAIRPPCSCLKLVVLATLLMQPMPHTMTGPQGPDITCELFSIRLDSLRCWRIFLTEDIFFIGQGHRCQTTITIIIVGITITTTVLVTSTTTTIIIMIVMSLSSSRKLRLGSSLNFL